MVKDVLGKNKKDIFFHQDGVCTFCVKYVEKRYKGENNFRLRI